MHGLKWLCRNTLLRRLQRLRIAAYTVCRTIAQAQAADKAEAAAEAAAAAAEARLAALLAPQQPQQEGEEKKAAAASTATGLGLGGRDKQQQQRRDEMQRLWLTALSRAAEKAAECIARLVSWRSALAARLPQQVIQKPCTTYIYLYIECAHLFDFIRTGAGPIAGVVPAVRGRG